MEDEERVGVYVGVPVGVPPGEIVFAGDPVGVAVTAAVIVRDGVEVTRGDGELEDEGGREADEVDVPVVVCVLVCDDVTLDAGVLVGEDVRLPVDVVVADCVLERVVLPVEEGVRVLVAVLVLMEVAVPVVLPVPLDERVEVGVVVGDCVLVPVDDPEPVEEAVPVAVRVGVRVEVGDDVEVPVIDPVTVPDIVLVLESLCDWAQCRIHATMARRRRCPRSPAHGLCTVGVAPLLRLGTICNRGGDRELITLNKRPYLRWCGVCGCAAPCGTKRTGALRKRRPKSWKATM